MTEKNNNNLINTNIAETGEFNFDSYFELHPEKKNPEFINFLIWFVGYAEGNGGFYIRPQTIYTHNYRTSFEMHSRDLRFLENIQKKLDVGTILIQPLSNGGLSHIYRIYKKENINKIIRILNGNAQLKKTHEQMKNWLQIYEKETDLNARIGLLPTTNKISLSNPWLSGFFDADGCFLAQLSKSKTNKSGFALDFKCVVDKHDEFLVLDVIREKFNSKMKIIDIHRGINNFRLMLISKSCLVTLVEYLEKYPLKTVDKQKSFENWKKLLKYGSQKYLAPVVQDRKAFAKLKKEIRNINAHSIRSPYYRRKESK